MNILISKFLAHKNLFQPANLGLTQKKIQFAPYKDVIKVNKITKVYCTCGQAGFNEIIS